MQQPYVYNPIARVSLEKQPQVASGLMEVFKKMWGDAWGVRMEHILRNALLTLLEQPLATIPDTWGLCRQELSPQSRRAHHKRLRQRPASARRLAQLPPHPQALVIEKLNPCAFKCLLDGTAHDGQGRAPAVLEILNGAKRDADLLRKLPLRPIQEPARGAALCRRNLHSPFIGKIAPKNNLFTTMLPNLRNIDYTWFRLRWSSPPMHAQIAATLRHLKQAFTHLHDARLIIENVDKATAQVIGDLAQATREQIRRLELFINSSQG
jgi:hypothetical protein